MKIQITSFKESGKWYDEFITEIPDDTELFLNENVSKEIYKKHPQLKEFYFMVETFPDDTTHWIKRMYKPVSLHSDYETHGKN